MSDNVVILYAFLAMRNRMGGIRMARRDTKIVGRND